ncbi:unnamed protein product [Amoebophrya sp. A120]|nr:unnamed protein product [Amoebophrya sp. A120]|eukprot:GSA120T00019564001.1
MPVASWLCGLAPPLPFAQHHVIPRSPREHRLSFLSTCQSPTFARGMALTTCACSFFPL